MTVARFAHRCEHSCLGTFGKRPAGVVVMFIACCHGATCGAFFSMNAKALSTRRHHFPPRLDTLRRRKRVTLPWKGTSKKSYSWCEGWWANDQSAPTGTASEGWAKEREGWTNDHCTNGDSQCSQEKFEPATSREISKNSWKNGEESVKEQGLSMRQMEVWKKR